MEFRPTTRTHCSSHRFFQEIADYLRGNVQTLAQASLDPDDETARVRMFVRFLERCTRATSQEAVEDNMYDAPRGRGGRYFHHLGRHGRYFSDFFVKVVFFTFDLRNDNYEDGHFVRRAFKNAVRLTPPHIQKLLDRMFSDQVFPSAATISRSNLYMDVSYMRWMAERHDLLT